MSSLIQLNDDTSEAKKKDIYVQNFGSQTEVINYKDRGIQLKKKLDFQMQTDEEIEEDIKLYEDDSDELLAFVKRMVPIAEHELIKSQKSKAFVGYEVNWSTNDNEFACIQTLQHRNLPPNLLVTSCSWNSIGSVIAVAYGSFDHENWCTHKSMLCTWNVDRLNIDAQKADMCIDLPTCVTCVTYHPIQTSFIAVACFNGEIMVWDTSRVDDMLIGSCGGGEDSHSDAITELIWIKEEANKYQLVSVGSDGRILFWKHDIYRKTLKLSNGFVILNESLPRDLCSRSGAGKQVGITCISFCPTDETNFVVGSDCGAIFKCATNVRGTLVSGAVNCSIQLRSPVNFAFSSHSGPVNSVKYSPHLRNIFLSCSTDATFRIYSVLQIEALMIVEPGCGFLYAGMWSPTRPSVLFVSSASGDVLLYDLLKSKSIFAKQFNVNASIYSLALSKNRNDVIGVGTADGKLEVWKLESFFINQVFDETQLTQDLFHTFSE